MLRPPKAGPGSVFGKIVIIQATERNKMIWPDREMVTVLSQRTLQMYVEYLDLQHPPPHAQACAPNLNFEF
jgi:hypothetical protein